MSKLSEYEKANSEARLDICVKKKVLDGKEQVVATLRRDSDAGFPIDSEEKIPKKPLVQEYTDMSAFGKCVVDAIKAIEKELA
jgi:hypothetical protein